MTIHFGIFQGNSIVGSGFTAANMDEVKEIIASLNCGTETFRPVVYQVTA